MTKDVEKDSLEALQAACVIGDLNEVKRLLPVVGVHDPDLNALSHAAGGGKLEVVQYLVEQGADVKEREHYATVQAFRLGFFEVGKYLLSKGGDIHAREDTILEDAAYEGNVNLVQFVLDYVGDEGFKHCSYDAALRLSARAGHFETLKLIMERYESKWGQTYSPWDTTYEEEWFSPLIGAISSNHLPMVKYLQQRGVTPGRMEDDPIEFAVMNGRFDIVKYLASVHGTEHVDKEHLLDALCKTNNYDLETINFLIKEGANIHVNHDAPFLEACKRDDLSAAKALFECEPDHFSRVISVNPTLSLHPELAALSMRHELNQTIAAKAPQKRSSMRF